MSRHFVTLRVPDQGGEYVLAGRMWVLAGAPQELIDAEQGSVAGHVTQSLFGRRQWSGVDSPVLFAGQYEDQESGWVYNRFRFYDPAGGVYGAQDPLGVGSNVGTAQGYVANPLTWVDALGLKAHPITDVMVHLLWLKSLTAQETKQSLQPPMVVMERSCVMIYVGICQMMLLQ